ncbi:MAG: UDP-N-acetylmuramate dehydrogenase [Candidatus Paceibacterota bacterium]|jgi:UDP-N-acetylmuramate dehydrogenase
MEILKNYDLSSLNSFHVSARAKFFAEIKNEDDFKNLANIPEFKNNEKLFLGGGSNILFTKDFDGIVILNKMKGIQVLKEDDNYVFLKVAGGEKWHDLVLFTVEKNLWGIENLALIHGTVGAAPVQNIGAYGSEVKDSIESVECFEIENGKKKIFANKECKFGYRDSIFKSELKGKFFIFSVTFKLKKNSEPSISYNALKNHLAKNNLEIKNSKDVSNAVIDIRKSKLPNPKDLGNAGSFFKNVYVDQKKLEELKKSYPEIPYFEEEGKIKIPAGWLVEQCGWKGKRIGNVGVHEKQALILVNYGNASGLEIKNLAEQIINSVFQKFGLKLFPEVNLI